MAFTQLPPEIQYKALNYSSRVSKHIDDPHQYYHHYCHRPVTLNEGLAYVDAKHPKRFVIFRESEDVNGTIKFSMFSFFDTDLGNISYEMNKIILTIQHVDVDEYQIQFYEDDNADMNANDIRDYFKNYIIDIETSTFYFDIKTLYGILNRRARCIHLNASYATDWIHQVWTTWAKPIVVNDMDSLFNYIKQMLRCDPFFTLFGELPFDFEELQQLTFRHDGEPYDVEQLDAFVDAYQIIFDEIIV